MIASFPLKEELELKRFLSLQIIFLSGYFSINESCLKEGRGVGGNEEERQGSRMHACNYII